MTRRMQKLAGWIAMAVGCAGMTGCRVNEHKDGTDKDVKISTPFGGVSVKTSKSGVQEGLGLEVYPGAVPEKKDTGNNSADVNLSFGNFHLGVKATSYTTPDAPGKVLAFYKGGLAKYGAVIECRQDEPVGKPVRTEDGLTCDSDRKRKMRVNEDGDDSNKTELKAGSKQHQHVVSVEPQGTGTKIGLVLLELPGKFSVSDEDEKQ